MRVAVVGVGAMGRNHARVYNDIDEVELVALADADRARAEAVARRFKVPAFGAVETMLDAARPDAISIAVPTIHHYAVARAAIARGIHVLVEKPMTHRLDEAYDLIEQADRHGVCLAVGHVERHNAAIVELRRRLAEGEAGEIYQIHAHRLSPFPQHIHDVGVVMDLATHDLDLMRYLLDAEVEYLFASTDRRIHATHEDSLCCILRFGNGTTGVLDINWLSPTKVREMRVTGSKGMFYVDYLLQDISFTRNSYSPSQWDTVSLIQGVDEGDTIKLRITKVEPLRAELLDFLDAIREGRPPRVAGQDGVRVLELAQAVLTSGRTRTVVPTGITVTPGSQREWVTATEASGEAG